MFKKLLAIVLMIQMALPLHGEEIKSFFDLGQTKQVKLVPIPEVQPVPSAPAQIKFEAYELPASASEPEFSTPQQATHIIGVGDAYSTVVAVANPQGCAYGVTCAHAVSKLTPQDTIMVDDKPFATLVAKDVDHDLAILEFSSDMGAGVELSTEDIQAGEVLTSYGSAGFLPAAKFNKEQLNMMVEIKETIKFVEKDTIFTDGAELHGRSGAGLYKNGKLVGTFQGIVKHNVKEMDQKFWGLAIYTRVGPLIPLLTPTFYNVTFYGGVPSVVDTGVVEVDEKSFDAETAKGLVLLDFWATWCGPCKSMEPIIQKLKFVKVAHINLDTCPNLAKRFNVGSIPRFILMKDGTVMDSSLVGIQTQETLQALIDKFDLARKQAEMFAGNDRRIVATWSDQPVPEWIAKKLPKDYQLPIGVWSTGNNHYSWPLKSGIYTVDQLYDMCKLTKAEPMKTDPSAPLSMGAGWRRQQRQQQQQEQPAGAIECLTYVDQMFGWYGDYLPQGATGKIVIQRSGARSFNLMGHKEKTVLALETLFGKTGSNELSVEYDGTVPEAKKLPIRHLKFGFSIDDDGIDFDIGKVRVYGLTKMVDDQLGTMNTGEQPKGFIGILTLISIISYVHTVYVLMNTVMDIELPGEIVITSRRLNDDSIVVNFEKDKQPFVKIISLMTFNLGINEVTVNRALKTAVAKFSGTIFAKQYTLRLK